MLYLKNVTFLDWENFTQTTGNLLVQTSGKKLLEWVAEIPANVAVGSEIIDCKGLIATKSFACGHHHIYSALARGMNPAAKNPENFYETLKYVWWTLDKCLNKDMIRASALSTAMFCAKNGVTFVIDHHASPNFIKGWLQTIAEAFNEVGISHLLCYEITDRDGMNRAEEGLQETNNYLAKNNGLVGLHASFTVSDYTLNKAVELAKIHNSGIHIHVAEDRYDQDHCLINYSKRVINRLNDAGALDFNKTILGHCLHLSDSERQIIAQKPVWIAQNTESNLNNRVGYFNSREFTEKVILGTDGMHSDMLRSAKAAFFVGQDFDNISYPEGYNRFRRVHKYLKTNNIEGDAENNLVLLNYESPTEMNENNFLGHFIFGFDSAQVTHVISNGKLIVKNRKLVCANEDEIMKESKKQATLLWQKMKNI